MHCHYASTEITMQDGRRLMILDDTDIIAFVKNPN